MAHAEAMTEQTALMNDAGATDDAGAPPSAPPPTPPTPPVPPMPPHGGGPVPPVPPSGAGGPQHTTQLPWYRIPVFRDPDDDMIGGVVSGVCQAYGFDRRTSRLALVIAGLVLPIVVVAYIVAWILLPDGREHAQPLEDIVRDKRRFPLYAALALLILVGGIGSLGSWLVFGDFPWGVGLIAIGVLLWMAPSLRRERRTSAAPGSVAGATTVGPVPSGWPTPSDASDASSATDPTTVLPTTGATFGTTASNGATLVPPPVTAPRRRRRRIPVGSITLLCVLAFIGIASAGDALDWWDVPALGVVVTSIVVMASGLAISTLVNRAWFFVPVVALLAMAAAFLTVAEPSLDGGVGDRDVRPATVADAERFHDLGTGQLTLDLVDVPLDRDEPVQVRAEVGVGRIHVIVPAGAQLLVTSEVGAGHVVIGDREVIEGIDQQDVRTIESVGDRTGTIELDLRVGVGEIDVDRDVFVGVGSVTSGD